MMPGMNEKFATLSGQLTELIKLQKDAIYLLDQMDKKSDELVKLEQGLKQQINYMNKTLDIIGIKVSPDAYPDKKKAPPPTPAVKKVEKTPHVHEPTDEELEEERIRKQMLDEAEKEKQAQAEAEEKDEEK